MKGVKGRFFRKLKFIPTFTTLKQQALVLQLEKLPNQNCDQTPPVYTEQDQKINSCTLSELFLGSAEDEEMEMEFIVGNKENITSSIKSKESVQPLSEIIMDHNGTHEVKEDDNEDNPPSLLDFEDRCPPGPGGNESVILYTTSLRGIRKTFEDGNTIRFLLESLKVLFYERDVSMHLEYREELWSILGGRVIPPRLFIKGKYIGGADEVVGLHEQGKLRKLLEGIPLHLSSSSCSGCANLRFVVCLNCNGSRKIVAADGENDDLCIRCPECNENGLVKCPICC